MSFDRFFGVNRAGGHVPAAGWQKETAYGLIGRNHANQQARHELNRQALAALLSTTFKDQAAVARKHALTKTVTFLAFDIRWRF